MSHTDEFISTVQKFYSLHRRILPWREQIAPYGVLISEFMLQQTQVSRVMVKYQEFMNVFPNFESLSLASFADVLRVWKGLGYNRRAKYLLETAQIVVKKYGSQIPKDPHIVDEWPGLGISTAKAIVVYTHNIPEYFIETNVRRVYIHHFFPDAALIHDDDIMPLLQETVPKDNPRDWYYALMDYGSQLAVKLPNPNRRSAHYHVQSKFEGSRRQIRGKILSVLMENKKNASELSLIMDCDEKRVNEVLDILDTEHLISKDEEGNYSIHS